MKILTGSDLDGQPITYNINTFLLNSDIDWSNSDFQIALGGGDIFEGNFRTITLDNSDYYSGLFLATDNLISSDNMPVISNLGIIGGVTSDDGGFFLGGDQTCRYVKLENCYSTGAIEGASSGGIVGTLSPNTDDTLIVLKNCYSRGPISGNGAAGILRATTNARLINCRSFGNISGSNSCGLVHNCSQLSLDSCFTRGALTSDNCVGLVNSCGSDSTITNCWVGGTISGTTSAGLVRIIDNFTISGCYIATDVDGTSCAAVCASATGAFSIRNCYANSIASGNHGFYHVLTSLQSDNVTVENLVTNGAGADDFDSYTTFGRDGTGAIQSDRIDILNSSDYIVVSDAPYLTMDASDGTARRFIAQQLLTPSGNSDSITVNVSNLNMFNFDGTQPSDITISNGLVHTIEVDNFLYLPDTSRQVLVNDNTIVSTAEFGGSYTINGEFFQSTDNQTTVDSLDLILGSVYAKANPVADVGGDPHIKPLLGNQLYLNNSWRFVKMYSDGKYQVVAHCRHLPNSMINGYLHCYNTPNQPDSGVRTVTRKDKYIKQYTYFDLIKFYQNNQEVLSMHLFNGIITYSNPSVSDIKVSKCNSKGLYSLTHHINYSKSNRHQCYQIDLPHDSYNNSIIITVDDYWDDINHIKLVCRGQETSLCGELYQHNLKNKLNDWNF